MVRYLKPGFKADEVTEIEGGAGIEEAVMVSPGDFEGVGDTGCARMSKGLQMRHGPLPVWVYMTVLAGKVRLETDDEILEFEAGSVFFIPAGSSHTETVLEDNTVLAHMTGPFDDPAALDDYSVCTVEV